MPRAKRLRSSVALLAILLLVAAACTNDATPSATPTPAESDAPEPPPECPLTGAEPKNAELAGRPAVAVKVENDPVAYPLSGLDSAEVVFEELVEGGVTRFMAIYHCTDAKKVGPVRSARVVDPGIMIPITRILGAAGGNDIVKKALKKSDVVLIDENTKGGAMRRIDRAGIPLEHTLYADTTKLRSLGQRRFDNPPTTNFTFGPLEAKAKKTRAVTMNFGGDAAVGYRWAKGQWQRLDNGSPLQAEGAGPIAVDNVLIELHTINNSKTVFDVAGNPSIEIADETGRGPAVLLRDGKSVKGKWIRPKRDEPVRFVAGGETMVFAPGTVWVELLPNRKGEIKGSFSLSK